MGRLLVVRHAQSVWNAAGRWQGWSDAPLSELGVEQARQAGSALAAAGTAPGAMASSDLARARRTAELIGAELGYRQTLIVDPDFRERIWGVERADDRRDRLRLAVRARRPAGRAPGRGARR